MLTSAGCAARRARLWQRLAPGIDWVLITDPVYQVYFANFCPSPFLFNSQNSSSVLILGRSGEAILVADNVQQAFIDNSHVTEKIAPLWYRCIESAGDRKGLVLETALKRMKELAPGGFGCEAATCPGVLTDGARTSTAAGMVSVDAELRELRRRKDPDEVSLLRKSMQAAEAGHSAGLARIQPGMTELDAYLLVQQAALVAAGEQAIVYGDFASGDRCLQGGGPTARVILPGDLVLLDFSVVIAGYRCDFANTFVCGGSATAPQRTLQDACLEAMREGEKLLRAGVSCRDVDGAVRNSFTRRNLGSTFTHHAGHGIGLGHPEAPFLVPESSETLVAGDVVTLEPGQYVPGVGGMRFERNYLITEDGYEILSHHRLGLDAAR